MPSARGSSTPSTFDPASLQWHATCCETCVLGVVELSHTSSIGGRNGPTGGRGCYPARRSASSKAGVISAQSLVGEDLMRGEAQRSGRAALVSLIMPVWRPRREWLLE